MMLMVIAMLLSFLLSTAFAKDLDGRYAVGMNSWFGPTPSVSARYAVPMPKNVMETQIEINFGFATDPASASNLNLGARGLYAIVVEDNMNLMIGGGAGFLMLNGTPALRLQPSMEIQYFLLGLDNLSFTTGAGINLDMGPGNNAVGVTGQVLGGFHYWF